MGRVLAVSAHIFFKKKGGPSFLDSAHKLSVSSVLFRCDPVYQWAVYFHPELSLLPKSPALFRGFKIVIE